MKSDVSIVLVLLAFSLLLPVAAPANDTLLADEDLLPHATATVQTSTTRANQAPNNLFNRLIAQEVTYQLDPTSLLKFSCNVASLSGTDLTQEYDLYASATADIQVELVVRF